MPLNKTRILDGKDVTTAEDATLGPSEEETEVVVTGSDPDMVIPGPDSSEAMLSEPRDVNEPAGSDEREV